MLVGDNLVVFLYFIYLFIELFNVTGKETIHESRPTHSWTRLVCSICLTCVLLDFGRKPGVNPCRHGENNANSASLSLAS